MNLSQPQKLMNQGRYDEALVCLDDIPPGKKDPRTEILRGRIEASRGDHERAAEVLANGMQSYPDHAPLALFYGTERLDQGMAREAAAAFEHVLTLQPRNQMARSYHGLALLKAGEDAAGYREVMESGFTDNHLFRVRLAEWLESEWLDSGRFFSDLGTGSREACPMSDKAALRCFYRRDFEKLATMIPAGRFPDLELIGFLSALGNEMVQRYTQAGKCLESVIEKTGKEHLPDPVAACLARVLIRQGHLREGAAILDRISIIGPEDFGVNYYLGILCLAFGKQDDARRQFEKAFTNYAIDTQEFQWWQILKALKREFGEL